MPSAEVLPATQSLCWPPDIQERLKSLEEELEEEEITLKGFWKKKWTLLEHLLTKDQLKQAAELKTELDTGAVAEKEYFARLHTLIVPKENFLVEPKSEKEALVGDTSPSSSTTTKPVRVDVKSLKMESGETSAKMEEDSSEMELCAPGSSGSGKKAAAGPGKGQKSILDMFKKAPAKRRSGSPDTNGIKKAKTGEVAVKGEKLCVGKDSPVSKKRCIICKQLTDSPHTISYGDHPHGAVEEWAALTEPKLNIEGADNEDTPQYKLTGFSVYDKAGHAVPFDTDLIESGKEIFFSGYLKNVFAEDPTPDTDDSVPVKDCGPITSWWTSGFDGGEKVVISFASECAYYDLMEPSELYAPLFRAVQEKSFIAKHTIQYLLKMHEEGGNRGEVDDEDNTDFEDFLNFLSTVVPPEGMSMLDQEMVIRHAEFIVNQVYSFEMAGEGEEEEEDADLTKTPIMKAIIGLAGVQRSQIKRVKQRVGVKKEEKAKILFTSATVTPLVREVFETVFAGQMEGGSEISKSRKRKCGVCENCMAPDCGQCSHCKDMVKFGGSGKSKQSCKERKCNNMIDSKEAEMSEESEDDTPAKTLEKKTPEKHVKVKKQEQVQFKWIGEGTKSGKKTYYEAAMIDKERVSAGDQVLLEPEDPKDPFHVGTVQYMYEGSQGPTVHIKWFARGTDTVLGSTGDPTELFLLDDCEDQPLLSVFKKSEVEIRPEPDQDQWRLKGGSQPEESMEETGTKFWATLAYNMELGRFEYPRPDPECEKEEDKLGYCPKCVLAQEKATRFRGEVKETSDDEVRCVKWDGGDLRIGDCVYLAPGSVPLKIKAKKTNAEPTSKKDVDEELYPEYYRKSEYVKGNNYNTPDPFQVAIIKGFKSGGETTRVFVQMFYRPENTHKGAGGAEKTDLNLLYWSEETGVVSIDQLEGRCYVRFADFDTNPGEIETWSEEGPDRWFFRDCYNATDKIFEEPPNSAKRVGLGRRAGGKGKGKASTKQEELEQAAPSYPTFPPVSRKLATLDVFAGCGGLSQGLHEAGVAESRWAVEVFEPAADAYKLNNPACTVFKDCCNLLLKNAIEGIPVNAKGQKIPKRGEVELLCGGPPCQGFSGMNRFNQREYSQFRNSLVASYLSYCEYYRPRYFILENVRNFASFKKSMVLILCMRALVKMGYQCTFGILQAGQFGVAQTRRRAILLAAAPGEVLPKYPEPRHVFSPQACHLSVEIGEKRFDPQTKWVKSAPFRTITVRDTMSDLPEIKNGHSKDKMPYHTEPETHFQRRIRRGSTVLLDHITKDMAPLIEKRFELIPTAPGSDWRDLPNAVMELRDGTKTRKLNYFYRDAKQGRSSTGAERGVCPCADGKSKCDPKDKQQFTLIPWCLPHTGNRHNNWAGLYGRVEWDGFFSTTITNPEPMGKQGRVLHPEQHRLVSVRECARSQGFPDTYKFHGTVLDKHRQVGNAVPPPMGKVLGLEIRKAMDEAERTKGAKKEAVEEVVEAAA